MLTIAGTAAAHPMTARTMKNFIFDCLVVSIECRSDGHHGGGLLFILEVWLASGQLAQIDPEIEECRAQRQLRRTLQVREHERESGQRWE